MLFIFVVWPYPGCWIEDSTSPPLLLFCRGKALTTFDLGNIWSKVALLYFLLGKKKSTSNCVLGPLHGEMIIVLYCNMSVSVWVWGSTTWWENAETLLIVSPRTLTHNWGLHHWTCVFRFQFENARDAEDAIRGRDGYNFDGCRLRVIISSNCVCIVCCLPFLFLIVMHAGWACPWW